MFMLVVTIAFVAALAYITVPYIVTLLDPSVNYGHTAFGKFDRYLNQQIYLDVLLQLLLFLGFVYYIVRTLRSRTNAYVKFCIVLLIIIANVLFLLPLLGFVNVLMMLSISNPPFIQNYHAEFPGASLIESRCNLIRKEYLSYSHRPDCTFQQTPGFRIGFTDKKEEESCWRMIVLKKAGRFTDLSQRHFPITCSLLTSSQIHNAVFSILDPRVQIPAHIGYYKGYLRYHLAIIVPPSGRCFIECGGVRYYWKENNGVMFDDMYYHHVENNTDHVRVVLYLDIHRSRSMPTPLRPLHLLCVHMISNNIFLHQQVSRQHQQVRTR